MTVRPETVVVGGAGTGLGAAIARRFAAGGLRPVLLARRAETMMATVADLKAAGHDPVARVCDLTDAHAVTATVAAIEAEDGPIRVAVFNAGGRVKGPVVDLDPVDYELAWRAGAFAGFLFAQHTARAMLPRGAGTILMTGATASVKAGQGSAAFAGGKFALRALAGSLARELGPQGIHVAHVIIDGVINSERVRRTMADRIAGLPAGGLLEPDPIAEAYWQLHAQHPTAWSWEIDVRPSVEPF